MNILETLNEYFDSIVLMHETPDLTVYEVQKEGVPKGYTEVDCVFTRTDNGSLKVLECNAL